MFDRWEGIDTMSEGEVIKTLGLERFQQFMREKPPRISPCFTVTGHAGERRYISNQVAFRLEEDLRLRGRTAPMVTKSMRQGVSRIEQDFQIVGNRLIDKRPARALERNLAELKVAIRKYMPLILERL
jgi:hypothetical protein